MANATTLTITELTRDGFTARPAGAVLDTGTVAVTLYGTISQYQSGRVLLEVSNGAGAALAVAVLAGDNPPAMRAGLGNKLGTVAAGSVELFGPFETARYLQSDGTFGVTLTPASGTVAGTVRVYALPIA
jgi:hypothetical protein